MAIWAPRWRAERESERVSTMVARRVKREEPPVRWGVKKGAVLESARKASRANAEKEVSEPQKSVARPM